MLLAIYPVSIRLWLWIIRPEFSTQLIDNVRTVVLYLLHMLASCSNRGNGTEGEVTPEVTKRCRLSLATNSALLYEPKNTSRSCGVLANEYSCAHGAQKNFGDQTPYLTYMGYTQREREMGERRYGEHR